MTNATRKWPRKHVCQQGRDTSEMPTSSQALILLNSELDTSLGLCSTRVRKAVTSTSGLMFSSLAIGVSQEQITKTTTTTSTHGCNTITQSFGNKGIMTISAPTSVNANSKQKESQQRDCLQKNDVWIPRSSCSVNSNPNHSYSLTDSAKCRSFGRANGGYHYRQPVIVNSRHSHGPIAYDQCQQNTATSRDPSEEVWPVLDVRKSQQFYRPLQSLHVSNSTGEALSPHSNSYEEVPPGEAALPHTKPSTLNPINRGLIQRLRELGFRSRDNKEKNKNIDTRNGKYEDEIQRHNEGLNNKLQFSVGNLWQRGEKNLFGEGTKIVPPQEGEESNIKDVITAIPLLTSLLQQNAENNGHSQCGEKSVQLNKIDPLEETAMVTSRRQPLQDNGDGNLESEGSDVNEREKVDRLVANLQAALHQKKYKPPSIRMRKELPETRPLSVCFGCGSNVHISHEEVKRKLESQYPGVSIVSLQFDPVSMNVGDPTTRNRWIVTLGKQDDCQMMMKGGVLLAAADKVSVRPLDSVLKEEHSAYKLHQFVQEAKAKMSLIKDDHSRKSKRSKHKAKKKKLAIK